ncbi:metallo-beta-lactamase family-like protein [Leishmania donovani]|uniref:Metallo-beta-lactamase_family-like_protein n=3 Tax=Leishmania donovani species complex TaxID=38574 RepID=A0A6L0XMA6_LEIIN|nr:metallo-beta-lactamase family-like protein [Leishmania infantum JPCM5]XP_003860590.1 metallo-beta-lactamase family-like protein [Leishmania donovani]CAC9485668.1 metallo-beta-lactamase_family-like_protein [Leishmania infantum]AYU78533.1 metallo-beta-lactamase family-like protein [Leishmania donovani]TPP49300.1 Metallo-beta-lactamase family protein [Leishmania donovani]TPP54715.1 Metallo-beta-lactamase family protein [Leishmania donovani]CAJ1988541.1 metallo-beta-lactamase family-like prote|eukprot:XP_001465378.1 metallo-beta-lactamase family-like protein [Leishmania infantum JPCM5]
MHAGAAAEAAMPPIATLSSRVVRIMGLNPGYMTLQGSNTYLVGTGQERLLIDSGEGVEGYGHLLQKAVDEESTRLGGPVLISKLLLTHWHRDHIGGVETVRRLFPQVQLLKQPSQYVHTEVDALCQVPPEVVKVEGATLQLLHTPGHTDDHLCAFLQEERALFTSDTVLGTGTSVFSSFKDYMNSLHVLERMKPKRLYPAHGPVVEDGTARIEEIIQHRNTREKQILQVLCERTHGVAALDSEKGLTVRELVDIIYTTIPAALKTAAGSNVFHHVKKLLNEGRVVVRYAPADLVHFLKDATDYTVFGEGADADVKVIERILTEFRVAAAGVSSGAP